MTLIHIHRPQATKCRKRRLKCHDCNKRSTFAAFFTPWYGWHETCLNCGREWGDGEWLPLAFSPTARAENIIAAKKKWEAWESCNGQ